MHLSNGFTKFQKCTFQDNFGVKQSGHIYSAYGPGARFSKLPIITGPIKLFCFPKNKYGSFKSFKNGTVKLLAKETKWASLEVRTKHTFLENLISKYDNGPVKLPGLSRNGPLVGKSLKTVLS